MKIIYYPAKFGDHRNCSSGDIAVNDLARPADQRVM